MVKRFQVDLQLEIGVGGTLEGSVHVPVRQHAEIDFLALSISRKVAKREVAADR